VALDLLSLFDISQQPVNGGSANGKQLFPDFRIEFDFSMFFQYGYEITQEGGQSLGADIVGFLPQIFFKVSKAPWS